MATGTSSPPPLPASTPANRVVDQRLAQVGSTLKSSDIGGGIMRMVAGLLAIVLTFVLVDHWVVGLPIWARCAGLLALLSWVGWCMARWVLPGAFRRINPAYSAQLVERANPGLRNSLLNFIFLRENREHLKEPVYRELEQRATVKVQSVDVDVAVDRTGLIRVGMVAAVLLFVFGAYTALSPKSPISTLARLLLPWKSIERPSRVRIFDVRPAATTVYAGRSLDVSARVDRTREEEPVHLVYSTVDRQEVDRVLSMKLDELSGRFIVSLPGNTQGIRAHLDYRIEAGDAVAGPFRVTVSPTPSMMVERVEYKFPSYTRLPRETVEGEGDVRAVEGTRVRIHAVANQPISSAYLEFDPDTLDKAARRTIRMEHDGHQATVSFRLRLREDRKTQVHVAYQLRFINANDETNAEPIQHRIDVVPDLPPIVEILTPTERVTDVPLNGAQLLEIRGLDPDFGLANLTLHGVARGTQLFEPRSLLAEVSHGQVIRRLTFRPEKFRLHEGDTVEIWATGFDNRFDVFEQTMAPNMAAATDRYQLRITAPEQRQTDENSSGDSQESDTEGADPSDGGEGDGGEGEGQSAGEPGEGEQGGSEQGEGQQTEGQPAAGAQGQGQDGEGEQGGEQGGEQEGEPASADGQGQLQPGNEQGESGQGEPGTAAEGTDRQAEGQQADGDAGETQGGEQGAGDTGAAQPDQEGAENGMAGERGNADQQSSSDPSDATGGEPSKDSAVEPDPNGESGSARNQQHGDPSERGESSPSEPVPSDGSSDGDAFERVMDRMRKLNGENADGTPKTGQQDTTEREDAVSEQASDGTCPHCNSPKAPGAPCENCSGDGQADKDPSSSSGNEDSDQQRGTDPNESDEASDAEASDSAASQKREQAESPNREPSSNQPGKSSKPSSDSPSNSADGSEAGSQSGGSAEQGQGEDAAGQSAGESDRPSEPSSEGSTSGGQEKGSSAQSGDPPAGEEQGQQPTESPSDQAGAQDGESAEAGEQAEAAQSGEGAQPSDDPQAGGEPKENVSGDAAKGANGSPSEQNQGNDSSAAGGEQPQGGAGPRMGPDQMPTDDDPGEPGGDDPNLEYARKATDLVLDYLKNQEGDPDPELLDQLGWTPDELRRFVDRWESLRKDSVDPLRGNQDQQQLDEALRSLGLHPTADRLQRGTSRDDQMQGVQDAGVRSAPPPEYEHLYKDFMRRRGKRTTTNGPRP